MAVGIFDTNLTVHWLQTASIPVHHFACFLLFLFSGSGSDGKAVFLRDIWPSREEIEVTCFCFLFFFRVLLVARGLSLCGPEVASDFVADVTSVIQNPHFRLTTTTTVLWPFVRNYPGEPVPEDRHWWNWKLPTAAFSRMTCSMRLSKLDICTLCPRKNAPRACLKVFKISTFWAITI